MSKNNIKWMIISVFLVAVLIVADYSAITAKSPKQKIIESIADMEIGIDEKKYNDIMEGMQKVLEKNR